MRLDVRHKGFNSRRRTFLDEMEAVDPAILVARPLEGKWSILEIIEHMVLAERTVLKDLPEPSELVARERSLRHRIRFWLVFLVLKFGIRVRVPSRAMIPQGGRSLSELRRMWDENQDWLGSCVQGLGPANRRNAVFEHPVAGPLTVEEAVRIGQLHVDVHTRQIREILRRIAN